MPPNIDNYAIWDPAYFHFHANLPSSRVFRGAVALITVIMLLIKGGERHAIQHHLGVPGMKRVETRSHVQTFDWMTCNEGVLRGMRAGGKWVCVFVSLSRWNCSLLY